MGQIVAGRFPLRQCLSARRESAVFLTTLAGEGSPAAAIRLTAVNPHWESAASLTHPHLIRIFESGRATLAGREIFYLVMEYADDNLAEVLKLRPLTPGEALEVLRAALDAVKFLHSQGFVHGRLRSSNVLAAGDKLKISPGNLRHSGDRAEDVRALGALMAEALTQRRPAGNDPPPGLPDPFRQIVHGCLDPSRRWTLDNVTAVLDPEAPPPLRRRPRYALWTAGGALILAVVAVVFAFRGSSSSAAPSEDSRPAPKAVSAAPAPDRPSLPKPSPAPSAPSRAGSAPAPVRTQTMPVQAPVETPAPVAPPPAQPPQAKPAPAAAEGGIVERVMPAVPRKAQNTIRGSVRVAVRVRTNEAGLVTLATFDSPGPSRYFAQLALDAAGRWRFQPRPEPSEWLLRFTFTRGEVRVEASPGR